MSVDWIKIDLWPHGRAGIDARFRTTATDLYLYIEGTNHPLDWLHHVTPFAKAREFDAGRRLYKKILPYIGARRVHIGGHSLGGAIALQAAVDHPNRVSALALIGSAGLGAEINAGYINGFIAAESRKEIKPLLEQLVANADLINRTLINDILQFKRIDGVTAALSAITRPRSRSSGDASSTSDASELTARNTTVLHCPGALAASSSARTACT